MIPRINLNNANTSESAARTLRKTPGLFANLVSAARTGRRRKKNIQKSSPEILEVRMLLTTFGSEMIIDGSFEELTPMHGVVPVESPESYRRISATVPEEFDELAEFNLVNGTSVGTFEVDNGWVPPSQSEAFNLPGTFLYTDQPLEDQPPGQQLDSQLAGFWHMQPLLINTTADTNGDGKPERFFPNGGSIDIVTEANNGLGVTQNVVTGGFQAQHESQSIELIGTPYAGVIAHDLETKPGALYRLEFYVSSNHHHGKPGENGQLNPRQTQVFLQNPSSPNTVAPSVFAIGPAGTTVSPGDVPGVITVEYSGYGWKKIRAEFRATTDHTRLAFSAGGGETWLSDPDIPRQRQQYLATINIALQTATGAERDSLLALQTALQQDFTIVPLNPEFYGPLLDNVSVRPINEVPDALDDVFVVNEDETIAFNVFADNGSGADDLFDQNHGFFNDVEVDVSTLVAFTQPANGVLTHNSDGSFSFDTNGEFDSLGHHEQAEMSFTYTVQDCFGAVDTATVTITVTGQNDEATVLNFNAVDIIENQTTTVTGTFQDTDGNDIHTVDIFWGDGTSSPAVVDEASRTFTASHRYMDDDPTATAFDFYAISAALTDWGNAVDTVQTQVKVTNAAPMIQALNSPVIDENGIATITGLFTDVGLLDTHQVEVNWGDGTTSLATVDAAARTFTAERLYLDDDPTGTASDIYTVGVTVSDDDLGVTTAATTVTVNNVAPMVQASLLNSTINENGTTTLSGTISDVGSLDTFTLQVGWNDSLSPNNVQSFTLGASALNIAMHGVSWNPATRDFTLNHQYLDDNPTATASDDYLISVEVIDDDTGSDSLLLTQTVNNVAPVLSVNDPAPLSDKGAEGEAIDLLIEFTDPGILDKHTVTVDWGDGQLQAVVLPVGQRNLLLEHVYVSGGVYDIEITVSDDDTGIVSASRTAVISGSSIQTVDAEQVLQIIGTAGDDHISINQTGNGKLKVHWDYLSDNPREFDLNAIDRLVVIMCDGDDHLNVSGKLMLPTNIDGGGGNDHLNGGGGSNVILGGDGNDHLNGGSSRDILIGGAGADRIVGGPGNDLMTGGIYSNAAGEQDLLSNYGSLVATQDRWLGDIEDILSGDTLMQDDPDLAAFYAALGDDGGAVDVLTGSSSSDWLRLFDGDRFTDQNSNGRGRRR